LVLTDVVKDSIALVEDEDLEVVKVEGLVLCEVKDTAWGADHDMGDFVALKHLLLLLERLTSKNNLGADIRHKLGQTDEFTLDLVGELAGVAQDHGGAWFWAITEAVKHGKDEDGCLSHTRDGLAKDIDSHDCLGDALLLDIRRMLEAAIDDRLLKLGAQNHILEGSGVHTNVVCGGLAGT
jgi:hypothetical protein